MPGRIRVNVERDKDWVIAVTISGPFGRAKLTRREVEHLLIALQPDLIYDNELIYLKTSRELAFSSPRTI